MARLTLAQVYLVEEDDGEVVLDIVRVGPTAAQVALTAASALRPMCASLLPH